MTEPRTGRMDVLLPRVMNPAALDAVIRLHVEAVLARTGECLATIDRGPGHEHLPGVMCWPVTYTTTPRPPRN